LVCCTEKNLATLVYATAPDEIRNGFVNVYNIGRLHHFHLIQSFEAAVEAQSSSTSATRRFWTKKSPEIAPY
jgi:hypothetical protein